MSSLLANFAAMFGDDAAHGSHLNRLPRVLETTPSA